MCFAGPAAAGMQFAVSAMSSLAAFGAQQQQAVEQEDRFNENYQNALADNRTTETSLLDRQMEEQRAYAQKDQLALLEGAEKTSQVQASAAAGNVRGNDITEVVNGIGEAINQKRAALFDNWQSGSLNIEAEKATAVEQETTRIEEVAQPYSPGIGGTLLGIAGAGLKAGANPNVQSYFGFGQSGNNGGATSGASNDTGTANTTFDLAGSDAGGIGMM